MPIGIGMGMALGAAGGLLGTGISSALSLEIAKRQMKFQERSYKHRHQWAVEDLRKAGLNPILSATGGAGGSLPGAAQPFPDWGGSVGSAVNSALAIAKQKKERDVLDNEEKISRHQANYWRYKAINEDTLGNFYARQVDKMLWEAGQAHQQWKFNEYAMPGAALEAAISRGDYGSAMKWLKHAPTSKAMQGIGALTGLGTGAAFSAKALRRQKITFEQAKKRYREELLKRRNQR